MAIPSSDLDDVQEFVRELLADFVEVEPLAIDMEADIFGLYAIESLQLVEMITALERRFGRHLEFDEFQESRTGRQIAERVLGDDP